MAVVAKRAKGRPKKTSDNRIAYSELVCACCQESKPSDQFYNSRGQIFPNEKIPYCITCLGKMFDFYMGKYLLDGREVPERDAIKRICMTFDIYYHDNIYGNAKEIVAKNPKMNTLKAFMRTVNLVQYKDKSYDDTIKQLEAENRAVLIDEDNSKIAPEVIRRFGVGFTSADYKFLNEQYMDWATRHECKTKAQEEVLKQICFCQLNLLKAERNGEDTKDLSNTFRNLLDTAKLQPKQNASETVSDAQTFGTLIDKWENTRPIPECDPDLKDVDGIGRYIDTFFKGHLSKMMGLKNGLSQIYENFMKKYTVDKPEYGDDENSEVLFDAIFGDHSNDKGGGQ